MGDGLWTYTFVINHAIYSYLASCKGYAFSETSLNGHPVGQKSVAIVEIEVASLWRWECMELLMYVTWNLN